MCDRAGMHHTPGSGVVAYIQQKWYEKEMSVQRESVKSVHVIVFACTTVNASKDKCWVQVC